jgi:hypothetical protein
MTTVEVDRELKAKHRALWASGDYPAVAAELIPEFGPDYAYMLRVQDATTALPSVVEPMADPSGPTSMCSIRRTPRSTPNFDAGRRIAGTRCRTGMGGGRRRGVAPTTASTL